MPRGKGSSYRSGNKINPVVDETNERNDLGTKSSSKTRSNHHGDKVNKEIKKTKVDKKRASSAKHEVEVTKRKKTNNTEVITAQSEEEGDEVTYEIEGQSTEFMDEEQDAEDYKTESDSEEEMEEKIDESETEFQSQNNNASRAESEFSEVIIKCQSEAEIQQAEEQEMQKFVEYMKKQGLVLVQASPGQNVAELSRIAKDKASGRKGNTMIAKGLNELDTNSEITVYHTAVRLENASKRDSSSSEDQPLDTSDEMEKNDIGLNNVHLSNKIDQFITDNRRGVASYMEDGEMLHSSKQQNPRYDDVTDRCSQSLQVNHAEEMIRNAERSRARIMEVPGKMANIIDQDYVLVGSHIDENLQKRIGDEEYIDFSKLMPKDKVSEEDNCMEMVNKGGMSFWVPVSDREMISINSFNRWEQAFRIFSNIYLAYHPSKAGELIQYSHIIHTASQSFAWENMYRYDREFHLHMSKFHLQHSWGIILQQA